MADRAEGGECPGHLLVVFILLPAVLTASCRRHRAAPLVGPSGDLLTMSFWLMAAPLLYWMCCRVLNLGGVAALVQF